MLSDGAVGSNVGFETASDALGYHSSKTNIDLTVASGGVSGE